jgi:flagellar hook-length control protein FliK
MTPTAMSVHPAAPATAPTTNPASTPAAAPTDFLQMLGQLAAAATPAAASASPILSATTGETTDEPATADGAASVDVAGLFALSLPVTPPPVQVAAQAASDLKGAIHSVLGTPTARSTAVAPEAQLLTDLIQNEQKPSISIDAPTGLDSPSLPVATDVAATARNTQPSPTDQILSRQVHHPVGSAAWADEIGSRLTLMAEHGKHTASLRLSPEHLGPLEIRIAVQDDQASVWFGAAHADTRAAIENALPRLRELLASHGLSLADAGVSHQAPRNQREQAPASSTNGSLGGTDSDVDTPVSRQVRLGLVDAYA